MSREWGKIVLKVRKSMIKYGSFPCYLPLGQGKGFKKDIF